MQRTREHYILKYIFVIWCRVSNATVSVANVENAHHSTRWFLPFQSNSSILRYHQNNEKFPLPGILGTGMSHSVQDFWDYFAFFLFCCFSDSGDYTRHNKLGLKSGKPNKILAKSMSTRKGPLPKTLENCKITVFSIFSVSLLDFQVLPKIRWQGWSKSRLVQSEQSNSPNTWPRPPLPPLIFAREI